MVQKRVYYEFMPLPCTTMAVHALSAIDSDALYFAYSQQCFFFSVGCFFLFLFYFFDRLFIGPSRP